MSNAIEFYASDAALDLDTPENFEFESEEAADEWFEARESTTQDLEFVGSWDFSGWSWFEVLSETVDEKSGGLLSKLLGDGPEVSYGYLNHEECRSLVATIPQVLQVDEIAEDPDYEELLQDLIDALETCVAKKTGMVSIM